MTVLYYLTDGVCRDAVAVGRTLIGRGDMSPSAAAAAAAAVAATSRTAMADGDCAYIRLDSPRAAVSRLQACIDVARNGDAWVCDCNSTNGTFVSVRPDNYNNDGNGNNTSSGGGLRLQPSCFYQLTPGCRIRFGDVERFFVAATTASAASPATAAAALSPSATVSPAAATDVTAYAATEHAKTHNDDDDGDGAALRTSLPQHGTSALTQALDERGRCVIHVDSDSSSSSSSTSSSSSLTSRAARKRARSSSLRVSPAAAAATTAHDDVDTAAPSSPSPPSQQQRLALSSTPSPLPSRRGFAACLSGMGAAQRDEVRRAVRRRGGRVVDDVVDADVLIVATPVARTPKVLVAIGRGIPVVSTAYVMRDTTTKAATTTTLRPCEGDDVADYVVSLTHNHRTYSSTHLRRAIFRSDRRPLLHGALYNIAALSRKTRQVAEEVIVGCGGTVARRASDPGVRLGDGDVAALYDAIVRGCRPYAASAAATTTLTG